MTPRARRQAVFLDRDGTLNRELEGALKQPGDLELLPGVAGAIARLNEAGIAAVVVSNQSAIARGLLDEERLARVHRALLERLADGGARLDLVLWCPHHPGEGFPPYRRRCPCRKPEPGMLLEAARTLDLDLERSRVVGDAARDLEAGLRAGVRGILVSTGKGARERGRLAEGTPFVRDLAAAVELVLADQPR